MGTVVNRYLEGEHGRDLGRNTSEFVDIDKSVSVQIEFSERSSRFSRSDLRYGRVKIIDRFDYRTFPNLAAKAVSSARVRRLSLFESMSVTN